ncbi:MAG: hypothetical protein H6748_06145 [Spirochaetaceae bacterium]|nr:hypothetical protein [Myxococcales bacterium]MCB9723608.1 hypothetical protein [Spirochaetaceae bacterium]
MSGGGIGSVGARRAPRRAVAVFVRRVGGLALLIASVGCAGLTPDGARPVVVRFESGTETEAFEIRAGVERIELIDRSGLLVAEIRRADRGLVVRDARGRPLGWVTREAASERPSHYWAERAEGEATLELKQESDGDFELEDATGETLYKLKLRDYGFKIVDATGRDVVRVRRSDGGKTSIRDADGLTYLMTRDAIPVEVAAVLVLPGLSFSQASLLAASVWGLPQVEP